MGGGFSRELFELLIEMAKIVESTLKTHFGNAYLFLMK